MTVRINTASHAELMTLPGIGPQQAIAIITWRTEHGPLRNEDQLHKVLSAWGLPDAKLGEQVDFGTAESGGREKPGA